MPTQEGGNYMRFSVFVHEKQKKKLVYFSLVINVKDRKGNFGLDEY